MQGLTSVSWRARTVIAAIARHGVRVTDFDGFDVRVSGIEASDEPALAQAGADLVLVCENRVIPKTWAA